MARYATFIPVRCEAILPCNSVSHRAMVVATLRRWWGLAQPYRNSFQLWKHAYNRSTDWPDNVMNVQKYVESYCDGVRTSRRRHARAEGLQMHTTAKQHGKYLYSCAVLLTQISFWLLWALVDWPGLRQALPVRHRRCTNYTLNCRRSQEFHIHDHAEYLCSPWSRLAVSAIQHSRSLRVHDSPPVPLRDCKSSHVFMQHQDRISCYSEEYWAGCSAER